MPHVRCCGFDPSALERGSRSEQATKLALVGMDVQRVSTRLRVEVLQKLSRPEASISSSQISRLISGGQAIAAMAQKATAPSVVSPCGGAAKRVVVDLLALQDAVAQAAHLHRLALQVVLPGLQHAQCTGAPQGAALCIEGLAQGGARGASGRGFGSLFSERRIALCETRSWPNVLNWNLTPIYTNLHDFSVQGGQV
jgi:hypothetical protein